MEIIKILFDDERSKREDPISGPNYAAIHSILAYRKVSTTVVDAVVMKCLELYKQSRLNHEAHGQASYFLEYGASRSVVEKVVAELAKSGFIGCIEDVAHVYLRRGLLPEEVHALVDNYCNDTAGQSSSTEDELMRLANRYLPAAQVAATRRKLSKFREVFHSHID